MDGLIPRITEAANNGKEILPAVSMWFERAKEKLSNKDEIVSRINRDLSVKSRYSLSRRAAKTAEAMKKLREECPKSDEPIAAVPDKLERCTVEFDSRKEIEEDVMGLLRNEEVKIIGIHGMGGVGKTTLADKIKNRVLSDGEKTQFDESLMVVVSQDPDMLRIQGEIAEKLGMKFEETSLSSRAQRLRERLIGGKRILIILDDVWKYLKLYELGIPCSNGLGRCTVLLTSRDRGVLEEMGAHKPIPEMKILTDEEALSFFKDKLGGIHVDDPTWLSSKVKEIVKECKCLPLALEIVARAMKSKRDHEASWDAALGQLRSANPADVGDVLENVYKPLRLSYDSLSENGRFMFLLCCLFAEDSDISVEMLTCYAIGVGMWLEEIEGEYHLAKVRNRTHSLIETIKNRSLLLESRKQQHVRMHDVVRDVGIYIAASKEKQLIKCGPDCEWISPFCGGRSSSVDLSGGSTFPKLSLLMINDAGVDKDKKLQIDDDFFKGMMKLNVLFIESNYSFESLPHSTQLLKDLRTLIIESCEELRSISIVGELVMLEILILRRCEGIEDLCWDAQGPKCLRLLEISDCDSLRRIRGGVISSVNKLEELIIINNENLEWEEEGLREIESLENLRRLEIKVRNYKLGALQIISTLPYISKFHIIIGTDPCFGYFDSLEFGKTMSLNCKSEIKIKESLIRNVEYLHLNGHVPKDLDLSQAHEIKHLEITDCSTAREHLWSSHVVSKQLSTIKAHECNSLRSLLPISRGMDCFPQLKKLCIEDCGMLEYVFSWIEQGSDEIISGQQSHGTIHQFPLLTEININNCPQLKGLISNLQGSDEDDHHSSHFFCKVSFRNLRSVKLWCINVESLFCPEIPIKSFTTLEVLEIHSLEKVKGLFSIVMAQNLFNLQHLIIEDCKEMVPVIACYDDEKDVNITFPNLKKLELKSLPRLTSLYDGIESIQFPELQDMMIKGCPELKSIKLGGDNSHHSSYLFCHQVSFPNNLRVIENASINNLFCPQIDLRSFAKLEVFKIESFQKMKSLFSVLIARNLVNLHTLSINDCKEMIQVIGGDEDEKDDIIIGQDAASSSNTVFPKLKKFGVSFLPKLCIGDSEKMIQVIGSNENEKNNITGQDGSITILPNLKELKLWRLPKLTSVYRALSSTQEIATAHHDHHNLSRVSFTDLKKLTLKNNDATSQMAFCLQIPIKFLTRLEMLRIWECDGMSSLFSCSTAANLINLRKLEILHCGKMVEVIEEEKEYSSHHNQTAILPFPNLKELIMDNMGELKIFSGCMRCTLNMASLKKVTIMHCPQMESFSLGPLTTPNLKTGDMRLNDTVYKYFLTKNSTVTQEEDAEIVEEFHLEASTTSSNEENVDEQERSTSNVKSTDEEEERDAEGEDKKKDAEIVEEASTSSNEVNVKIMDEEERDAEKKAEDEDSNPREEVQQRGRERCIEHCTLFLPDGEFEKDKLVQMWIAEDCIEEEASTRMEDTASSHFDALVDEKVIMPSDFDSLHSRMKYKVNNAAGFLKQESYARIDSGSYTEIAGGVLHLTWQCKTLDQTLYDALKNAKQLRTLVVREDCGALISKLSDDIFSGLKLLRTLDLSYTHVSELPGSIGSLVSLRCLDVSETPITKLPESVDRLEHLHSLILRGCFRLLALPRGLGRLTNLCHLDLLIAGRLKCMPKGMGSLTKLQTLQAFLVGESDGCGIRELKNMNEITGSFCISMLENVASAEEAKEASLGNKRHIENLELRWLDHGNEGAAEVLECLRPHFLLKELQITFYSGSKLPRWISDPSFVDLASLTLFECINCDDLLSVGVLPSLKKLHIVGMKSVRNIDTLPDRPQGFNAFPKLEKLTLENMDNLEEWTGNEDGDFPCLSDVSIRYCPKLCVFPSLSHVCCLQHLEISHCNQLVSLPADGILPALESLIIRGCPKIKERCRKIYGLDWVKIIDVKNIWVDFEKISTD